MIINLSLLGNYINLSTRYHLFGLHDGSTNAENKHFTTELEDYELATACMSGDLDGVVNALNNGASFILPFDQSPVVCAILFNLLSSLSLLSFYLSFSHSFFYQMHSGLQESILT